MQFIKGQENARRQTSYLLALFSLAVLSIMLSAALVLSVTYSMFLGYTQFSIGLSISQFLLISPTILVNSCGSVLLFVLAASCLKWFQLRRGGAFVAAALGGTPVLSNTQEPLLRLLMNVVEEMSLASRIVPPRVFILKDEAGINAFAAGNSTTDAVVAVSQGALDELSRDQLQGVVAHEFSHILNEDMRLNSVLAALLYGIECIALPGVLLFESTGSSCSRSSWRNQSRGSSIIHLAAGCLYLIGRLGYFFGELMRSAVSRQREYLADASAVQFTRNPDGLAEALKIVAAHQYCGQVDNSNGPHLSHLFFVSPLAKLAKFQATHPPLEERIRKLDPRWDGKPVALKTAPDSAPSPAPQRMDPMQAMGVMAATMNTVTPTMARHDAMITPQVHLASQTALRQQEPLDAAASVLQLLLSDEHDEQQRQLAVIDESLLPGLRSSVSRQISSGTELPRDQWFELIERCMPALRQLSEQQIKAYLKCLLLVIQSDQKTEMWEWCIFQMVKQGLAETSKAALFSKAHYKRWQQLETQFSVVLSNFVYQGHSCEAASKKAFAAATDYLGAENLRFQPDSIDDFTAFSAALNEIDRGTASIKAKLVHALAHAAKSDGGLVIQERQLIDAICARLDFPPPELSISHTQDPFVSNGKLSAKGAEKTTNPALRKAS